jgi:hypothetical protein
MMDDRNDINRPLGSDPNANQRPLVPSASYSWGIPAGIAALFLLAGVLFYNSGGHGPDQTATNNTPSATSGPVAPGASAPGPTTTAPAPNR